MLNHQQDDPTVEGDCVNTPVSATVAKATRLAGRIDNELAEAHAVRVGALSLVKDNPWCVLALSRRGIVVGT